MKEIVLNNGDVVLVSDEDFEYLNQFNWSTSGSNKEKPYASTRIRSVKMYMHHLVLARMKQFVSKDTESDHEDRNSLNNQRNNLRIVTHSVNTHNRNLQQNSTSGMKGVYFDVKNQKWRVEIRVRKVKYHLGCFTNFDMAVKARKDAEKRFGVES